MLISVRCKQLKKTARAVQPARTEIFQERADLLEELAKVLVVLGLQLWQALQLGGHVKLLPVLLLRDVVQRGSTPERSRGGHQLPGRRADGRIPAKSLTAEVMQGRTNDP
jgi:hypothetical protein